VDDKFTKVETYVRIKRQMEDFNLSFYLFKKKQLWSILIILSIHNDERFGPRSREDAGPQLFGGGPHRPVTRLPS
jgi:hypothetical protein